MSEKFKEIDMTVDGYILPKNIKYKVIVGHKEENGEMYPIFKDKTLSDLIDEIFKLSKEVDKLKMRKGDK